MAYLFTYLGPNTVLYVGRWVLLIRTYWCHNPFMYMWYAFLHGIYFKSGGCTLPILPFFALLLWEICFHILYIFIIPSNPHIWLEDYSHWLTDDWLTFDSLHLMIPSTGIWTLNSSVECISFFIPKHVPIYLGTCYSFTSIYLPVVYQYQFDVVSSHRRPLRLSPTHPHKLPSRESIYHCHYKFAGTLNNHCQSYHWSTTVSSDNNQLFVFVFACIVFPRPDPRTSDSPPHLYALLETSHLRTISLIATTPKRSSQYIWFWFSRYIALPCFSISEQAAHAAFLQVRGFLQSSPNNNNY